MSVQRYQEEKKKKTLGFELTSTKTLGSKHKELSHYQNCKWPPVLSFLAWFTGKTGELRNALSVKLITKSEKIRCTYFRYIAFHGCCTLYNCIHYITLHFITLHYITLHCSIKLLTWGVTSVTDTSGNNRRVLKWTGVQYNSRIIETGRELEDNM